MADCIISATKSTMKSDGKQKQSMAMFVMHIKFQDAELDLKETEERAYRSIGEDLDEMRQILDKKRFNDFKSNIFRLLNQHRKFLWFSAKKKNQNSIKFRQQKRNGTEEEFIRRPEESSSTTRNSTIEESSSMFPQDHPKSISSKLGGSELEKIGILVSDQSLNRQFSQNDGLDPISYGGVEVDTYEAQALLLHPKMRLLEPLKEEQMEMEFEKCFTMVRYDEMKSQSSLRRSQEPAYTHSNLPFKCGSDSHSSSFDVVASTQGQSLNFPSMRVTEIPTNKVVLLPETLETQEETKLLAFRAYLHICQFNLAK